MAWRFVKTSSSRASAVAALSLALVGLAVFANPAQARHFRHYRHYVNYHAAPARDPAFAAIVVDANSGRTLYAASENETRHPASLTKVMTLYLLFEQLEKGRLTLASPIVMSAHAASQAPSKLGLDPGETLSVDNAIKAIVTRSANDVAVAVAENIGGDEEGFAQMMTRKAHALGMLHTTYVNASGLPDDRQVTSARDLTVLGRAIQERFPRYFRYFSTASFEYAGEEIGNHNHLLGRVEGVDGIKTGYTRASGFNLLTSVHRDGRALVAVVMGGPTAAARDRYMESLIAQHIASATTQHTATMIADASTPTPMVATPPVPPVREAEQAAPAPAAPTPPARAAVVAASAQEDAEGDGDNVERDGPAPEAAARPAKWDIRVAEAGAPAAPVPPARNIEARPAAHGWVKGPESVAAAEPKASLPAKAATAPIAYAPTRVAEATPAALGWVKGPSGIAAPSEAKSAAPAKTLVASAAVKEETRVAPAAESRSAPREPAHEGWLIQIGATDQAGKANDLLVRAKAQNRSGLASATPYTEKVERGGGTFYRARFAGLESSATAESACRTLKRSGFSCFATHD